MFRCAGNPPSGRARGQTPPLSQFALRYFLPPPSGCVRGDGAPTFGLAEQVGGERAPRNVVWRNYRFSGQEDFLGDIFGKVRPTRHLQCEAVDWPLQPAIERYERLLIAGSHAPQQFIVGFGRCGRSMASSGPYVFPFF